MNEGTQCVSISFTDISHSKYGDLEDLVYRLQLAEDEIVVNLNFKKVSGSTRGYTLSAGVYEVNDNNFMSKSLLPKELKVNITNEDVKLKSNLTTSKTTRFTKKSFFIQC